MRGGFHGGGKYEIKKPMFTPRQWEILKKAALVFIYLSGVALCGISSWGFWKEFIK